MGDNRTDPKLCIWREILFWLPLHLITAVDEVGRWRSKEPGRYGRTASIRLYHCALALFLIAFASVMAAENSLPLVARVSVLLAGFVGYFMLGSSLLRGLSHSYLYRARRELPRR